MNDSDLGYGSVCIICPIFVSNFPILALIAHTPVHINGFKGVRAGVWNAQAIGQVTEMHMLKVSGHFDAALFISVYDITMAQP